MKAAWNQSYTLPVHLTHEKPKPKFTFSSIWNGINNFFGLESIGDYIWFYGFYSLSFFILLFIAVVSNVLDMVYR